MMKCFYFVDMLINHQLEFVPVYMSCPLPVEDWHYRHAALMAISAVGEGCQKQMTIILGEVVTAVLPFCQDPHYRVRYAACNALGQMANDFYPGLQKKYHDKVRGAVTLSVVMVTLILCTYSTCVAENSILMSMS